MKKIFFVIAMLSLLAASCNKTQTLPRTGSGSQSFTGITVSGFEGYNAQTTYTLQYDPADFSVSTPAGHQNTVNIKALTKGNSGKTSTIQIFNNEGAGFADSEDLFKNLALCPLCKKVANNVFFTKISAAAISDQISYSANGEEWVVFKHEPGFVIIRMLAPDDKLKSVIASLALSVQKNKPLK